MRTTSKLQIYKKIRELQAREIRPLGVDDGGGAVRYSQTLCPKGRRKKNLYGKDLIKKVGRRLTSQENGRRKEGGSSSVSRLPGKIEA
jgi:hypothetical protein